MKPIEIAKVQTMLESLSNQDVYLHLETTNGAYASHFNNKFNVGAFIRNAKVNYSHAKIVKGEDSYRIGLKIADGWIYAEGLTDWEVLDETKLLVAGHDQDGRLMVALQLSQSPFR